MEVYYFSGTGNSLYVARQLRARFPDAVLIPIASLAGKEPVASRASAVGFVFPIHAFTLPWPVRIFLEKATFSPASYKFAIATRVCFKRVFESIDRLLARQNTRLDACFCFEMPETYVPLFNTYSREQVAQAERRVVNQLDTIGTTVAERGTYRPKDPWIWMLFSRVMCPPATTWFQKVRLPDMGRSFYANDSCNGCGTCEKVCLSTRIRLESRRPVWEIGVRCSYCLACLHFCPSQAIQIAGRNTAAKGRYHHPAVTADDIASQKCS